MVGWHHRLNGHEFEQIQEMVMDMEAWRSAVHGGREELDMTERLNLTELTITSHQENQNVGSFSILLHKISFYMMLAF